MKILMGLLVCTFPGLLANVNEFNIVEAIEKFGYPAETHEVVTEDGYILAIHRIPHGRTSTNNRTNKYPVLVNHGLMASSDCFIILGPGKSLGFVLADNDYDVWLTNARGSWHSRTHRTLDPDKDRSFWQYSWHEIGVYDLPATIDYILGTTKKRNLHYVGHSQGTTSIFVMGSERPEYNAKVKLAVLLSPSALFKNMRNPLFLMIAPWTNLLKALVEYLEIDELPPPNLFSAKQVRMITTYLCGQLTIGLCKTIISVVLSSDTKLIDSSMVAPLATIATAGFATKQILHYAQLLKSGNFEQYDLGVYRNLLKYNSKKPPLYNFSRMNFPAALIYSETDEIIDKEDVKLLKGLLPNVVDFYKVPYERFGHTNFVIAKNIDIVMNVEILKTMKKYND